MHVQPRITCACVYRMVVTCSHFNSRSSTIHRRPRAYQTADQVCIPYEKSPLESSFPLRSAPRGSSSSHEKSNHTGNRHKCSNGRICRTDKSERLSTWLRAPSCPLLATRQNLALPPMPPWLAAAAALVLLPGGNQGLIDNRWLGTPRSQVPSQDLLLVQQAAMKCRQSSNCGG